ncbi:phage head closure protein [Temperatibacter marinus]|uniref:Phage head closure protein n=1 Tax=Temperatibacter marinus TaxID=1456591 RepID=A0AA52EGE1_9PROT|nr:phage head closure protein [Temperatibacter marinus]WND02052.1 phage head closure protein [Temperatibacter marinus]
MMKPYFEKKSKIILGHMNKSIRLYRETHRTGRGGQILKTYAIIENVWAAVSSRYSSSVSRASTHWRESAVNFILYNSPTYRATKRIEWEDTLYTVYAFRDPDGDQRFLEVQTTALPETASLNGAEEEGV